MHHSLKMASLNLVRFAKSVKNYTRTLFARPLSHSDLVLDNSRGLAIASVSKLGGGSNNKIVILGQ